MTGHRTLVSHPPRHAMADHGEMLTERPGSVNVLLLREALATELPDALLSRFVEAMTKEERSGLGEYVDAKRMRSNWPAQAVQ